MASHKNPIEKRLESIAELWTDFAELPDARIWCVWVAADEVQVFDTFIAVESDEGAGELPDFFLRFSAAFESSSTYGFALCSELTALAQELQTALDDPAIGPWSPPQAVRGDDDVSLWVKTAASFAKHYALPGHFAAVLVPEELSSVEQFQIWLQRFAAQAPENLRVVVLDDVKAPALSPLVKAEPIRVVAAPLDLDMPAARLEISHQAGGLDTPGGQYRHSFVQLSNALNEGNLPQALSFGQVALGIAQAQKWFALAVPIHFALGAALAGNKQEKDANERYLQAEIAAAEGENAGDPACAKLRPQARMARGGLLISMKQFPMAAQLFTETIPLATKAEDPRMVLDCHRLASFSYEQAGQYDKAWNAGVEGLGYAKTLDEETRKTSNLPYLGEGMLRISKRPEYKGSDLTVEREMVGLLGTKDWRPKTAPPAEGLQPNSPGGSA